MKNIFLRVTVRSIGLILITVSIAFGQAGTVRTQNAWARPVLKDVNFNVLPAGTTLLPNTDYYVSLEALAPIAADNLGNPVLYVLYIETGDGFAAGILPRGVDVPVPGGRGYQGDIRITTDDAANLPPQLYIRYRGLTYEPDANNFLVSTPTVRIQQAFLP